MKEDLRKEIKALTAQIGVSGYEWDIAKYIAKEGPKVLYGAHLDEVGYVIKTIGEDGFLYFGKVGGSSENILPGRKVLIKTEKGVIPGVIGTRSTHMLTEEEIKKMQSVKTSYVDICAGSREQAMEWGVMTGCQMVIESPCTEFANTDYVVTKAAVTYLQPDYCYIFDTVPSGDVPDTRDIDNPLKLGGGAAIMLAQHNSRYTNYAIAHPKLLAAARETALENDIKTQEFAFVGAFYSNDGAGAINAGIGNAVLSISLPRRYSHSPTEVICLDDCVAIEKLLLELAKKPLDINMLKG